MEKLTDIVPYLDPELQDAFAKMPNTDLSKSTKESTIKYRNRNLAGPSPVPDGIVTEDIMVPGLEAGDPELMVRVYRPADGPSKNTMYYIHGGGFVGGNVNQSDPLCFEFVKQAGCNVVSVEYRLTPEAVHPQPVNDCYAGLLWVDSGPDAIGGKPDRIAISGGSAGGCLAAAVTLMARDRNGPSLCHQWLMAPVLDDRHETLSAQRICDNRTWSRDKSLLCWGYYLDGQVADKYAAPARETDLSSLPPATLTVKEVDLLRDEAVDYATRLTAAGVPTELKVYMGTCHAPEPPEAAVRKRMNQDLRDTIKRIFA